MSLESTISEDIKTAMKAKDAVTLRAIRAIKSAVMIFNTSGTGETLSTEGEIALLQKKEKQDIETPQRKTPRQDIEQLKELKHRLNNKKKYTFIIIAIALLVFVVFMVKGFLN